MTIDRLNLSGYMSTLQAYEVGYFIDDIVVTQSYATPIGPRDDGAGGGGGAGAGGAGSGAGGIGAGGSGAGSTTDAAVPGAPEASGGDDASCGCVAPGSGPGRGGRRWWLLALGAIGLIPSRYRRLLMC